MTLTFVTNHQQEKEHYFFNREYITTKTPTPITPMMSIESLSITFISNNPVAINHGKEKYKTSKKLFFILFFLTELFVSFSPFLISNLLRSKNKAAQLTKTTHCSGYKKTSHFSP